MSKCSHQGIILLYSSNFKGWYLWCEKCKEVWPDFGVWQHRKKAEKFARANHLDIVTVDESIYLWDKKKGGKKNV